MIFVVVGGGGWEAGAEGGRIAEKARKKKTHPRPAQDRSALSSLSPTNFSETGAMQRNVKTGQPQTTLIEIVFYMLFITICSTSYPC